MTYASDLTVGAAVRSASAARMSRHRDRRRKGLRCIALEIREGEIEALVRRELLTRDGRADVLAIRRALYAFLDDHLR